MKTTITKLESLMDQASQYISNHPENKLTIKPHPNKWSKKEILGHLIDSGINNLQRFTEIQFGTKPYPIRKYDQDQLVIVNDYQNAETMELLNFWKAINKQIIRIIERQSDESLKFEVIIVKDQHSDLKFLIEDYADHMEHHLKQIMQ